MTAIGTAYMDGVDLRKAEHVNVLGLALAGLGIEDDNAGKPILAPTLYFPLAIRLSALNESAKAVAGSSYTVPAGKWFILQVLQLVYGGGNVAITPSGGSATVIGAPSTYGPTVPVNIPLGPGDMIAPGTDNSVGGLLIDAPTDVTRVAQLITESASYTVPANKRLVLTHWREVAASNLSTELSIDGVVAFRTGEYYGSNYTYPSRKEPILFSAGQVLSVTDGQADGATYIGGYLLSV